jgi:hypothetical protein
MSFKELPRSKVLEIVAFCVERYHGERAKIVFDAKLKERDTNRLRQVDIAVFGVVGGRSFTRIVEVQARGRRAGVQFVDAVVGKLHALRAHRATIVATAGISAGAVERIKAASETLDAYELRPGAENEWPHRWKSKLSSVRIGDDDMLLPLEHLRYCEALSGKPIYEVLLATFYGDGVICHVLATDRESDEVTSNVFSPTPPAGKKVSYMGMTITGEHKGRPVKRTFRVDLPQGAKH